MALVCIQYNLLRFTFIKTNIILTGLNNNTDNNAFPGCCLPWLLLPPVQPVVSSCCASNIMKNGGQEPGTIYKAPGPPAWYQGASCGIASFEKHITLTTSASTQ